MTIPPMFDLTGRVALVAGGTKGIAEAFARQYVAHGGKVTIAARDAAACAVMAAELNAAAGHEVAWGHPFDLGDTASIDVLVDAAIAHWGQLDTLFCCSFFALPATIAQTRDEDFTETFRLNVVNWSHAAHRALPALKASDLARIIFVSSASGVRPAPSQLAYGLAKLSLTRLSQTLAIEWGCHGIRVNTLTPGMTATPAVRGWLKTEEEMERRTAEFPIRRLGTPDEIAAGGIFLAAPASGFTTGLELISDGGRTLLSGNTGVAFS